MRAAIRRACRDAAHPETSHLSGRLLCFAARSGAPARDSGTAARSVPSNRRSAHASNRPRAGLAPSSCYSPPSPWPNTPANAIKYRQFSMSAAGHTGAISSSFGRGARRAPEGTCAGAVDLTGQMRAASVTRQPVRPKPCRRSGKTPKTSRRRSRPPDRGGRSQRRRGGQRQAGIARGFRAVGESCKGCHDRYRKDQKLTGWNGDHRHHAPRPAGFRSSGTRLRGFVLHVGHTRLESGQGATPTRHCLRAGISRPRGGCITCHTADTDGVVAWRAAGPLTPFERLRPQHHPDGRRASAAGRRPTW